MHWPRHDCPLGGPACPAAARVVQFSFSFDTFKSTVHGGSILTVVVAKLLEDAHAWLVG